MPSISLKAAITNPMTRRVELYGRLRDAGLGDAVELEVGPKTTAAELLRELARRFGAANGLLEGSALATESEVLNASALVPASGVLAVLPPVCGG